MVGLFFSNSFIKKIPSHSHPLKNTETLKYAFHNTPDFNQNLNGINFDTSNIRDMSYLFFSSAFNHSLDINTSNVTDMSYMFSLSSFNQPLHFNT